MVIDTDYRVRLMNRAAREFSQVVGATETLRCYEVSHRRDEPCGGTEHPCPLQQVRQSGQRVTVVHQHYQSGEHPRVVEVVATPLRGQDGSFQGIIESIRDITDRKRSEEALQQSAQRLRALTARLSEVSELERQRLARELHDQVGQNLTALGINLNIIRAELQQTTEVVDSRLQDSLVLLEQTAVQIRNLMSDLRPPVLDDYGLMAALHWYAAQFSQRTGIDTLVEGQEPDPRLPRNVENALFRIAQEALTNVAKHAQASSVMVTLERSSGAVQLVIADDGIGFDTRSTVPMEGAGQWGLLTMQERAEAAGGHCWIESQPGQGTRVTLEIVA